MNNVFDFKRFGKYYVADLRHTFDYSALSILLTSFTGVIAYLFLGLMKLIVSGEWMSYGSIGRSITFVIAFTLLFSRCLRNAMDSSPTSAAVHSSLSFRHLHLRRPFQ